MKNWMLVALFTLLASITSLAGTFTNQLIIRTDFRDTPIDPKNVTVEYAVNCSYEKKFLDIIEGRIGIRTKSCGEAKYNLSINENGELILPAVPKFDHSKGDDLNRYIVYLKIKHQNKILLDIAQFKAEGIQTFYAKQLSVSFQVFELTDFEILKDGQNAINSPEFAGADTPVTVQFSVEPSKIQNISDCDFKLFFRAYQRSYTFLAKGDESKLGKVNFGPNYYPIFNNEKLNVIVEVYLKTPQNEFVLKKFTMPFTPEAMSQLKSIEL